MEIDPFISGDSVHCTKGFSMHESAGISINGWRQLDKNLENVKWDNSYNLEDTFRDVKNIYVKN